MAEEIRFFVRTAIFTIVIGSIYWFVSYEEAGTALLVGIIASAAFFAAVVTMRARTAGRGRRNIRSLLGFDETGEDHPLGLREDLFPAASAAPLVAAVASLLVGLGLLYGPWLWIPGVALGLAGAWTWLTGL